jgi:two-component system, cell cycle response regulator DivK
MGKKILIAEDSSVILNLTKKILIQQHYEIDAAKDGEEVLKKLEDSNYDLILMDINIPKIDGMECTKQIRALSDPAKSSTPIFAITGNAKNYSVEDFTAVGINEFLQKPIDFDQLVNLAAKYID